MKAQRFLIDLHCGELTASQMKVCRLAPQCCQMTCVHLSLAIPVHCLLQDLGGSLPVLSGEVQTHQRTNNARTELVLLFEILKGRNGRRKITLVQIQLYLRW